MNLNGVIWPLFLRYSIPNTVAFLANYVKLVKHRPMLTATEIIIFIHQYLVVEK